jgi:hypothetical protein
VREIPLATEALKMEEDCKQRNVAALRGWEGKQKDSPLEIPEEG